MKHLNDYKYNGVEFCTYEDNKGKIAVDVRNKWGEVLQGFCDLVDENEATVKAIATIKEMQANTTVQYHRQPTPAEIRFGDGAIHYRTFSIDECIKPNGELKRWFVAPDDGLRYYY